MQKPVPDSGNSSSDIDSSAQFDLMGEYVPYYNTLFFTEGQGYEFKNIKSNKLLITLDGGPGFFGNRIGERGEAIYGGHFVDWLLPLYAEYNIFVPEKFHWGRRVNPFWDFKNRERYTVDNLILNYASVITEYLSQNNNETIIIAGFSEGGIIAPELYFHLKDFGISALVSIGAGGLISPVDIAAVRLKKPLEDESIKQYLEAYNNYYNTYKGRYEESPEEQHFRQTRTAEEVTLLWRYSIDARRPFELYKDISIPVLFIHGQLDTNISVISTRYVEENLPDKPFDYIYYPDMIHYPETIGQLKKLRTDIANWLREKGL
jgi:pimeloyl-ACP methyl ester carboxylesterase